MKKKIQITLLVVLALILCLTACGGEKETEDDGFGIGDPVQIGDVIITLDEISLVTHKAKATFTIENRGTTELVIDPETTFMFFGDNTGDEVSLELDPNCPNELSGTIPAGGSLSGQVCVRSDPTLTWPLIVTFTYTGGETESGPAVWTAETEM